MKMRIVLCLLLVLCVAAGTAGPACAAARIGNDGEMLAAMAEMREMRAVGFKLSLTKKYFASLTENDFAGLSMIFLQAGITNYRMLYSASGNLTLDDVSWTDPHVAICGTEEEFRASVQEMLAEKVPCCQIAVGSNELLEELISQGRAFQYAAIYGAEKVTVKSIAAPPYVICLDEITYYSVPWIAVSSAAEWKQAVEQMAEADEDHWFLIPGDAFAEELRKDKALEKRLENLCPAVEWRSFYTETGLTYRYEHTAFLAGERIRCAYARNNLFSLTKRERDTLAKALEMAELYRRGNPLDTAREIHDALCAMIVYTDDDSTSEDDNAIGALLNGQANCDGYADAFSLVGSLAGLEVRCQQGLSRKQETDGRCRDVNHLWNLLKINGTWRMVDVTWDDQETRILYNWFNIGADRAHRTHAWDEELSLPLIPETVPAERPENEYAVRDTSDVSAAVSDAAAKGRASFTLMVTDGSSLSRDTVLDALQRFANRSFSFSWNDSMLAMDVILD